MFMLVNSTVYVYIPAIIVKDENKVKKCVHFAVLISEQLKTSNILYIQFSTGSFKAKRFLTT
jgi:hypothetical protein